MPKKVKMKHKKFGDEDEPEKDKDEEMSEDDEDAVPGLDDSDEGDY